MNKLERKRRLTFGDRAPLITSYWCQLAQWHTIYWENSKHSLTIIPTAGEVTSIVVRASKSSSVYRFGNNDIESLYC